MIAGMNDTFSPEKNGWRSINNSLLHHVMFILIILWELLVAVLLFLGAYTMTKKFKSDITEFTRAKKYTTFGLSLGVLLWFTVFIAVGGEWFLMWQSKNWNAQSTAFLLTCCFLLFLIHHNQEVV
jgi:predicted small integral membrane protein